MGKGLTPYCHCPSVWPVPGTGSSGALRVNTCLEDGRIGLLFHEQRNVLERVAKVQAVASTNHVLAGAGDVVGKTDARADVLVVVTQNLADVRIRDRTVERDQLLIRCGCWQ